MPSKSTGRGGHLVLLQVLVYLVPHFSHFVENRPRLSGPRVKRNSGLRID